MRRLRTKPATSTARSWITLVLALVAVASLDMIASPAVANELEWRHWQKRNQTTIRSVDHARRRYGSALAAYEKARHRRSVRGEKKKAVLAEREKAQEAWTEAERRLVEFRDEARRAGVPPGYLRDAPTEPLPSA